MNETDMADIAAYLSGPNVLTQSKSDVPAANRPKATEVCLACHGTNGVGITADYPTIAGQHEGCPMLAGFIEHLDVESLERLLGLAYEKRELVPRFAQLAGQVIVVSPDPIAALLHLVEARELRLDPLLYVTESREIAGITNRPTA